MHCPDYRLSGASDKSMLLLGAQRYRPAEKKGCIEELYTHFFGELGNDPFAKLGFWRSPALVGQENDASACDSRSVRRLILRLCLVLRY